MLKRNPDGSWECSGPAWPGFQLQVPAPHMAHESHEAGTMGSEVVIAESRALGNG